MIYSDIREQVRQYLDNRTDLDTYIRNWVNNTRKDLAIRYPFKYLYAETTASTEAGSAVYSLPPDYLGHLSIFIGTKKLMKALPNEFDNVVGEDLYMQFDDTVNDQLYTTSAFTKGESDYYIDRGMYFELYPVPDAIMTLTLKYSAQPADFLLDAEYDYISTFHFEAVIAGAVLRGARFLDDEKKEGKWTQIYEKEIQNMIKREKDMKFEDAPVRMKTYRDFDVRQWKRLVRMNNG